MSPDALAVESLKRQRLSFVFILFRTFNVKRVQQVRNTVYSNYLAD